ncbi:hypothetical protein DSECCO2_644340 [anaerobic digester metagenome]
MPPAPGERRPFRHGGDEHSPEVAEVQEALDDLVVACVADLERAIKDDEVTGIEFSGHLHGRLVLEGVPYDGGVPLGVVVVEVHFRGALEAAVKECIKVLVPGSRVDRDDMEGRRSVMEAHPADIRADRCPDGGNSKTARVEYDGVAPIDGADGTAKLGSAVPIGGGIEPAGGREPLCKIRWGGLADPSCDPPDGVQVKGVLIHHANSLTRLAWSAPISTTSVVENSSWTSVM